MLIPRLRNDYSELPRLATALATLSAVGFSLVLCAQISWMQLSPRSSYVLSNVLGAPARNLLLSTLGAGIFLPALAGLLLLWRRGARGLEQLEYLATLLSPLALACIMPGLFLSQVAQTKPLFYLVVLSAAGLVTRALVGASVRARRARIDSLHGSKPRALPRVVARLGGQLPSGTALLFVSFVAALFAWYFARTAVTHHRLILTTDTDLGIAENLMANLAHGNGFHAPANFGTLPGNYLSIHADYVALLFVPLYRLLPNAETLLWLQAALAALAVVPLFLLAARLLGQAAALWVSAAYLLLAPLHSALAYGFSWLPAFCLFSFTLYYAVISERRWLIALALPALLACSDAGPFGVLALGLFLITSRKQTGLAVIMCLLAVCVFAIDVRFALRAGDERLPPVALGVRTLLRNPIYFVLDLARATKLAAMLHALAPLALAPLAPLSSLPLLLPGLFFSSGSAEFWPGSPQAAHDQLLWIPGCLLSLLIALSRLRDSARPHPLFWGSVVAVSLASLSHSYNFGFLLHADALQDGSRNGQFKLKPDDNRRYAALQNVIRQIPPAASVAATTFMLSHVSSRTEAFDARRPFGTPDYVFFSTRELSGPARTAISTTLSHGYALAAHAEEFYLFRRAAETPETSQALRSLGLLSAQ